jgi:aryl-alcohol dehydrogenase-like predicted oxidoreductase
MQYVKLGRTGLDVSRICLGCMSYGEAARGGHAWALDEESARPFFKQALDGGINFFDSANVYSAGTSEEFLGRAIKALSWLSRPRSMARCGRAPTDRACPER